MMLRGVMQLRRVDPGFDPRQDVMMEMNPTYSGDERRRRASIVSPKLLERSRRFPAWKRSAANNSPPFVPQRPWNRAEIAAEGQSD